jgi:hypothetical protein
MASASNRHTPGSFDVAQASAGVGWVTGAVVASSDVERRKRSRSVTEAEDGSDLADETRLWRERTLKRLSEPLNAEVIQSRDGPGGQKLYYLPADATITLANKMFEFTGWNCELLSLTTDFVSRQWAVALAST